ncbi:MAG: 3-hydroxyisobutyrate dehydrogenase, partial [Robiginitomaculum sp.]
ANREYAPGFTSNMMLKDLRLSQDAAETAGAITPLGANARSLYEQFAEQGSGDVDFSGIIRMLRAQNDS